MECCLAAAQAPNLTYLVFIGRRRNGLTRRNPRWNRREMQPIEGQLRLAQAELEIVQRELERRAAQR